MSIMIRDVPKGTYRPPVPSAPEPAITEPTIVEEDVVKESLTSDSGITSDFSAPIDHTIERPVPTSEEDVYNLISEDEPRFSVTPVPQFEFEDLPDAFREAFDDNLYAARRLYATRPEVFAEYVDRHVLKKMAAIPDETPYELRSVSGGAGISETVGGVRLTPEGVGMTEQNFRYWMEKDRAYIERRAEERDILAKSRPDGYATKKLTERELSRLDAQTIAAAEALYLGKYSDGVTGAIGRAAYDIRAGFKNVASFALGGAEGITRALSDFTDMGLMTASLSDAIGSQGVIGKALKDYPDSIESSGFSNELDGYSQWLREEKLDTQAETGPEIDTGNEIVDFVRSSVFRTAPMLATSVGVAMIPGVGTAGAAGIMGAGMGAETYGTLRDEGLDPLLSLSAAVSTGVTSYFTNKFQLGNLAKYVRGQSPLKLFSFGTLRDVAAEGAQEALENTAQAGSEGLARLIGDKDYDSKKFWDEMKAGFLQSLDEGASVGVTTFAMRLFGFPLAARNQMRSMSFERASSKVAQSISKTEMFTKNPEGMAGHLTAMAAMHGDGNVYTTVESLNQAGVTREKAVAKIEDGGLGVDAETYDTAAATEGFLSVGYGSAMVFGAKEAEAGNKAASGAFMVSPEAMSVGDIVRQREESIAVITAAETYYQEEVSGDSPKTPIRIQIFKQGLKAAGFDAYQAAAVTAVYRAGAERSAALAGETVEEWLARKNVRLEFEKTLSALSNRAATRYANLLRELDGEPSDAGQVEAPAADDAISPAQEGNVAEILTQPAVGDGDNRAWVDEATANILNSLGLQGDIAAQMSAEIRAAVENGIGNPDVREIAGRLGIELPAAAEPVAESEAQVPGNEKRAKFDAAPTLAVTTEGVAAIPDGAGFTGRLVEWARDRGILGTFENADTGWSDINVTPASIRSVNSHKAGRGKLAILEVLPDLIRNGIYLETTQRNDKGVASHIFSGKVSVDWIPYIVGFSISEDQNGKRYYNHELTEIKEETPGALWSGALDTAGSATNRESTANGADTKSPTPLREPISSIVRRHLFVNPDQDAAPRIIETLYQPGNRGEIIFNPDRTVIRLFTGADVSTVVHELNHLFLNDLIALVKSGKGGETAKRQLDALNDFAGGGLLSDDAETRRDGYEKIARAWEMYLMTAEAPAPGLEDVFVTIRKYVAAVYRNVRENNPLVEPSAAVRNVFDSMLATDRQIEDAARIREVNADWTKSGGVSEEIVRRMDAINARRDERKRRRKDAARGAGRAARNESTLDARRRVIRGELSGEPVHKAIELAKAHGGFNRISAVALIGEAAVRGIEERHGAGVFNKTGNASYSPTKAAREAGFDYAGEMYSAMLGAQEIDARADRDARTEVKITDIAEDIFSEAEEESEGTDEDADKPKAAEADMVSELDEPTPDELDMIEEVGLAMANEGEDARETNDRLRAWRNEAAGMKRAARARVFAMPLREATSITQFTAARKAAARRAFTAQGRGDKAKVTALKKREMYHFYEVQASKASRALRDRITTEYSAGGLRTTINAVAPETQKLRSLIEGGYGGEQLRAAMSAAEHNATVEYGYARSLAEMALYAGTAESRFLKELAGDRAGAKTLELPAESEELSGIVGSIAETLDPWLLNKEKPANFADFRDFTVEQLSEIDRVMRWLIDSGRGKLAYLQGAEAENLNELTLNSIEPMLRRPDRGSDVDGSERTEWGRLRNRIGKYIISLTIPENWFMAMDGNPTISGGSAGINQRLLFETMQKANVEKDILYSDVISRMKPGFETFVDIKKRLEKEYGGRRFLIDGLPVPKIMKKGRKISEWDADLLLSVALQMGNDANLRRLLTDADFDARFGTKITPEGGQNMNDPRYNFTNKQLARIAGMFTDPEWDAIQSVWDAADSLYARSDEVTFKLTNRHVRKEPATAFVVRTADGKEKMVRGGYFPLVNDPRLSVRAEQLKEGQSIEEYIQSGTIANVYGSTKQSVGAIKSRARNEQGIPMSTLPQILDTRVIVQHVDTMAHYIAHALPLRDIDRLTRSEAWRSVYVAKFGQERYAAIRKWVKNIAAPERGSSSAGGDFAERLRSLATVNALGLRWKTGMKQRLGAFSAAAYMGDAAGSYATGWKYLAQGIGKMGIRGGLGFVNPAYTDANEKSKFMKARDGSFDREMREMQHRVSPLSREFLGRTPKEWQNMAFFWIQANDRAMAYSVWWGAYFQAKAGDAGFSVAARDGGTVDSTDARVEEEAVAFADRAVRTQASSFAADLTEIQRDRGIMRFLSMFMSGNVRQGSRLMQYIDSHRMGDKTKADIAMVSAKEFAFPALAWVFAAAAVKYALKEAMGFGGDDDDDGNLLADAAWEVTGTAVAPFPLVRDIPRVVQYGFISGDVPAISSATRAMRSAARVSDRLADARYMLAVGEAMRAAGYAVGVPVMNPLDDFFGVSLSEALGLKKRKGER